MRGASQLILKRKHPSAGKWEFVDDGCCCMGLRCRHMEVDDEVRMFCHARLFDIDRARRNVSRPMNHLSFFRINSDSDGNLIDFFCLLDILPCCVQST